MKPQTERWVASSVIVGSIFLIAALGLVMGKFTVSSGANRLTVNFPTVTGISVNSPVKYAGAPVGRVRGIRVLPKSEQTMRPNGFSVIQVELDLNQPLELTQDIVVGVKQDGFMGSKYINILPGRPDGTPLAKETVLEGEDIVELTELGPDLRMMITEIHPTLLRLDAISSAIETSLPSLLQDIDSLVENGNQMFSVVNNPEAKQDLQKMLSNMRVVSENLKIVSTYTKGFSKTVGEKPWRVVWGGTPNKLPSEEEILKSNKALPVGSLNAKD
jgi:phospholipid/cholesterol/gamma-HCH transport system substrate-binding protein